MAIGTTKYYKRGDSYLAQEDTGNDAGLLQGGYSDLGNRQNYISSLQGDIQKYKDLQSQIYSLSSNPNLLRYKEGDRNYEGMNPFTQASELQRKLAEAQSGQGIYADNYNSGSQVINGNFTTAQDIAKENANKAMVASGQMRAIDMGNGVRGYLPATPFNNPSYSGPSPGQVGYVPPVGAQISNIPQNNTNNSTAGTTAPNTGGNADTFASQYAALLGNTSGVDSAQQAIDTQNNLARNGIQNIGEQPIGMSFISGQQRDIENRNTNLQIPLQQRLANEQQKRQASLDALRFQIERSDKANTSAYEQRKDATEQAYKDRVLAETIRNNTLDSLPKGAVSGGSTGNGGIIDVPLNSVAERQLVGQYTATKQINSELEDLKALYNKYGTFNVIPNDAKAAINNKIAIITGAIKDAETLGTLDKGVLDLVDRLIPGPGSITSAFITKEQAKTNVGELQKYLNSKLDTRANTYGVADKYGSGTYTGKQTPKSEFSDIKQHITIEGDKAYIPRSVWSTMGNRMDALLEEAKRDGYTLLIKD